MGHWIDIATDGGSVRGWRANPSGPSTGAVLVIQEIFGVNPHIRKVAERFAEAGYVALAPALFDRAETGVELGYSEPDIKRGRALAATVGFEAAMNVLESAADLLKRESLHVGAVGFCWGGSLALLCNTRLGLPAVDYYGARSVSFLDEPLRAPLMCHFGQRDASISTADVTHHKRAYPQAKIFTYPADHAFNRDSDPRAFAPGSAQLASQRTLKFLRESLR